MKTKISKILTLISLIILSSCASIYKPINPPKLGYNLREFQDGIDLSYKYDVLKERGNKKYARKEQRKGVKLVAIQLTNNTDTVVNFGKDFNLYLGQSQIVPMEPIVIHQTIKQIVPGYLPYLLLTFVKLYVSNGTSVTTYPIGLALGPGITIGNMAVAGTSNKKMLMELIDYNILDRDIQKGETIYGIIGIRDSGYGPITIKKKN